jgi:hypothetical protein
MKNKSSSTHKPYFWQGKDDDDWTKESEILCRDLLLEFEKFFLERDLLGYPLNELMYLWV